MEDKKINNSATSGSQPRPTIEFDFDEPNEAQRDPSGLVFETADTLKLEEGENALKSEEKSMDQEPETETENTEFSLPDEFVVNEKYNTPTVAEEQTRIWSTYLPRFTGASDNYRMKNDPRPRATDTTVVRLNVEGAKHTSGEDPTAETDNEHNSDSTVVVVSGSSVEPEGETLNVFKFKATDTEMIPKAESRTPVPDPEPVTVPEDEVLSKKQTEPEVNTITLDDTVDEDTSDEPKDFNIPDPVNNDVHIVDYSAKSSTQLSSYTFAPAGASEQPNTNEKREFTTHGRRDDFKDKFLDLLMSSRIRIIVGALVALALLAFENIGLFGIDIIKIFRLNFIPGAKVILDVQLCACIYLLALPEIVDSFKQLFHGRLYPSFMLTVQLAVLIAYACFIALSKTISYPLFGFLYAVFALTLMISAYLKKSADFSAFKHISKSEEKYILDKKDTASLELENLALDGAVDEYKSKLVRMFKTTFVSDFFKRTGAVTVNTLKSVITIFATLGVSLVVGVVCFFIPAEGVTGLTSMASAFVLTYLLSCPALSLLSCFVSYYHCERTAIEENCAVLGDESFLSYSDVDVITFEDDEIFTEEDVNLKRLMLYGDRENMTKAMRQMASLFAAAGGPLDRVFSNSLDRKCQPATNLVFEEDGISGVCNGKRICAGNEEYMSRYGIFVPTSQEKSGGADTTKVMYAAENGQIYAKFDIRYSFSEEFTMIMPTLKEQGIVPLIYTRDPNVNNELLASITRDPNSVRVMKKLCLNGDEDTVYRRASTGIVTFGDKLNALNMLLLSKKYAEFKKRSVALEYTAMSVGAVLAAVISLAGLGSVTAIFGLWHLVGCAVISVMSRKSFLTRKKKKETDNV